MREFGPAFVIVVSQRFVINKGNSAALFFFPDWEQLLEEKLPFWLNVTLPKVGNQEIADSIFVEIIEKDGVLKPTENSEAKVLNSNGLNLKVEKKGRLLDISLIEANNGQSSPSKTKISSLIDRISGNSERALSHRALSPFNTFRPVKGLYTVDSTNGLALFGGEDGQLKIYSDLETQKPTLMRDLKGHIGDINTAKFFPSGKVVLSGGADFALKIWDLGSGNQAAMLKGHTRGVLSCDFVDRGRNVVSSARDGSVILHDVPTQTQIYTWNVPITAINSVHVASDLTGTNETALDKRDFNTEGKLITAGLESGSVLLIDLRSRATIATLKCPGAVNAVFATKSSLPLITAGGDWSGVSSYDLRNLSQPLHLLDLNGYGRVLRFAPSHDSRLWAATAQGVLCLLDPTAAGYPNVTLLSDNEPINGVSVYGDGAVCIIGSRNGIVRTFNTKTLN